MRIEWTGKITDEFYVLGHASVPVYLLDGTTPALFDAGFTGLAQVYEKDIREILGARSPAYLFLTHAHWDHIGSAAYFKAVWPQMQIVGSRGARDILAKTNVVKRIRNLNQEAIVALRAWGVSRVYKGQFESPVFDQALDPGQIIELEPGQSVKAIPTPGHTWDFLSYWLPEKKILVAAEAAGCDDVAEFLVDYDAYRTSLGTLSQLDVEILCTGHHLVLTGADAKKHISKSLDQAADYMAMVERFLREEGGNADKVIERVKVQEWDPKPLPKQPERAYLINTKARVLTILKRMEKMRKKMISEEKGCRNTIQERMTDEESVTERIDKEGNKWTKAYFGGGEHFRNWLDQCKELGEVMVEEVDSTGYKCFEMAGEKLFRIWMKIDDTKEGDLF